MSNKYIPKLFLYMLPNIFRILIKVCQFLEMCPKWFDVDKIPYKEMWPDDIFWYEFLFKRQRFQGYFLFEGHDTILSHEIKQVS